MVAKTASFQSNGVHRKNIMPASLRKKFQHRGCNIIYNINIIYTIICIRLLLWQRGVGSTYVPCWSAECWSAVCLLTLEEPHWAAVCSARPVTASDWLPGPCQTLLYGPSEQARERQVAVQLTVWSMRAALVMAIAVWHEPSWRSTIAQRIMCNHSRYQPRDVDGQAAQKQHDAAKRPPAVGAPAGPPAGRVPPPAPVVHTLPAACLQPGYVSTTTDAAAADTATEPPR